MRRLACGCRDPLFCECRPPLIESPPLTEKMIDAGAQAARHLLDIGLVPLLEDAVLDALYARGGDDRELAQQLWELAG
jgi:hypothetical protein